MKKFITPAIVALLCILTMANAQEKLIDRVVATVGSNIILQSEIDIQYAQAVAQGTKGDMNEHKCYLLQQLLTTKLLAQQAAIDSIEVSETEVDDEINRRMRYMTQQFGSKERLETFLRRSVLQYKEEMRTSVAEQLKAERMQSTIVQKINVTPQEVKRYFEALNPDSLPKFNTEFEIGEIVIKPVLTKEEKEQFRVRAEGYRKQVLDGTDFGTVARLYSEDGSAPYGGDLGYATRENYVKEFSAMAFKLKKGEVSPVFETQYGFHFLQVLDRRGEEVNVRHVLVKIKPTQPSLVRTKEKIDSVYNLVKSGKITFNTAASIYSDNNETKFNGGMLMNQQSNSRTTIISAEQLDKALFTAIDPLKPGEYSSPQQFVDERTGDIGYRFNFLKTRIPPHEAHLNHDFAKIQEAARMDKVNRTLSEWFETRRQSTFIDINTDFMACDDLKIWTKNNDLATN